MSEVYFIHAVVVISCHYTHTIGLNTGTFYMKTGLEVTLETSDNDHHSVSLMNQPLS
jgi:hypothetical protein